MKRLTRIKVRKPLTVDPLFFSRVLQRAGNALLKEVNYYGLLAIDLEDLQGVRVAATVVRSWDQNVPNYLGPSMLDWKADGGARQIFNELPRSKEMMLRLSLSYLLFELPGGVLAWGMWLCWGQRAGTSLEFWNYSSL